MIGNRAFWACLNISSIVLPDNILNIGDCSFASYQNLSSIVLPENLTSIGFYAFFLCISLTSINCEAPSQPAGWDRDWKYGCDAIDHWGYTGD